MPHKNLDERKKYQAEYGKKWYQKNKEKTLKQVADRKKQIYQIYYQYKATLKCEQCGENHPATLQFHHIDPNSKTDEIGAMVGRGLAWDTILEEIKKCQVLCANCHAKLHWDENYADVV